MNGDSAQEKVIQLKDIIWKREGKLILDQVSWNVQKGEHWAIVGLNGSGKTSLLNMITGYQWPSSGQIDILGERLGSIDIRELRKSIGWVSSSLGERYLARPNDTAHQVVISGKFASIGLYNEPSAEDENRALQLLETFHVLHIADKFYRHLSQGEKQKVMLARAWMTNPDLIILDEPCSGLDIKTREELLKTIHTLATQSEGPTLLYVTHRIEEIISCFTHTLLINSGRVVAAGEKEFVLTDHLLEAALELPLSVRWENNRPWVSVT